MKFIKTKLTLLLFIFLTSCSSTRNENNEIFFRWEGFDFNGKHYKYGAIFIPVSLQGVDKEFEMQFDLGMNVNVIYERPLKTIIKKYPELESNYFKRNNYEVFYSKLHLDKTESSVDSLFVSKNHGSNKNFEELKKIGTIGLNEFNNKILVIDYSNQTLQIFKKTEDIKEEKFTFIPIEIVDEKIKVNLTINGNQHPFLFDTGAGLVPATTIDYNLYKGATSFNNNSQDSITANSWGKPTTLIGNKINNDIYIGKYKIGTKNKRFYYTENKRQQEFFKDLKLKGSIGNVFFIENIIVLDFINNRLGIKNNS